jgi:integrase/recombinase XerD
MVIMESTDLAITGTVAPALPDGTAGDLRGATAGWLFGFGSIHTRNAYRRDLLGISPAGQPAKMTTPAWLPWCAAHDLDPLAARKRHVSAYARVLEADGHSPGTRARKLSVISSWYDYLISEELTERNPAKITTRPDIDRDASPATGLSVEELDALLDEAFADGRRAAALISVLYFGAFRVGSVLGAKVGDLGWEQGERTLRLTVKGGHERRFVIEAAASDALEAYLASRGEPQPEEPLFTSAHGPPLLEQDAWRLVRRLARQAGISSWAQLNPHSLRHTHITHARDAGVPLDIVQETAGHKDGRTTLRYDRARFRRSKRSGTVLSDRRRQAEEKRHA